MSSYSRGENDDGRVRPGESSHGMILDLEGYRIRERHADPRSVSAADFDRAICLEELNLLRRIALALENLSLK